MRDYSRVAPTFWIGHTGKQIRGLGRDAQVVALYLCTAPSANLIGLFYLPLATLCHEIGLSLEEARKALQGLSGLGFAHYDEATEFVWVVNAAQYQVGAVLHAQDTKVKAVAREWRGARKTPFYVDFHKRYAVAFRLPEVVEEPDGGPTEGVSRGYRGGIGGGSSSTPQEQYQEKDQEHRQDQEHEHRGIEGASGTQDDFDLFWEAYPLKEGKGAAEDAWKKHAKGVPIEVVLAGIRRWEGSEKWAKGYVVMPAKWLEEKRWGDDPEPVQVLSRAGQASLKAGQRLIERLFPPGGPGRATPPGPDGQGGEAP